jgi:hypothetical protein
MLLLVQRPPRPDLAFFRSRQRDAFLDGAVSAFDLFGVLGRDRIGHFALDTRRERKADADARDGAALRAIGRGFLRRSRRG